MSLREWLRRAAAKVLGSREIHGLTVLFGEFTVPRETVIARLELALSQLRDHDQRRYRWVQEYVGHILVWPGHYSAYDKLGGILLSADHVRDCSVGELLGIVVHEATHLRLARRGIRYTKKLRARIEARCVEEQIEAMKNCHFIDNQIADEIRRELEAPWWREEDRRRDIAIVLRRVGFPAWAASIANRYPND